MNNLFFTWGIKLILAWKYLNYNYDQVQMTENVYSYFILHFE